VDVTLPLQGSRPDAARTQQYSSLSELPAAILVNAWQGWQIQQARREAADLVLAVYTR